MVYDGKGHEAPTSAPTPAPQPPRTTVQFVQKEHYGIGHWIVMALLLTGIVASFFWWRSTQRNAIIERQERGEFTPQERALMAPNASRSQPQAIMVKPKTLHKNLTKDEKKLASKENLEVDSYTEAKATLTGHTEGGTISVHGTNVDWWDTYHRFHFWGNIMDPESLKFTYNQRFAIRVVVLRQTTGGLRVQTLHLYELAPDGSKIGEAKVDMDASSFQFSTLPPPVRAPVQHWLLCIGSNGDVLGTYLPWYGFGGQVGFGFSGGSTLSGKPFIGGTVMVFPPRWAHSSIGLGASVGWSPKGGNVYRIQVAWSFGKLF